MLFDKFYDLTVAVTLDGFFVTKVNDIHNPETIEVMSPILILFSGFLNEVEDLSDWDIGIYDVIIEFHGYDEDDYPLFSIASKKLKTKYLGVF